MRYSIIHHDVREKFDLTVAECIVADSISKLCRLGSNGTTFKSNVEIGKFIGYNEISVRRAKESLLGKGLIFEMLGGVGTTPLWEENNTFQDKTPRQNVEPPRQNVEETVQNVEHTISKEYKEHTNSNSSELLVVKVTPEKPQKEKKDTAYRGVFDLWGSSFPRNWIMNTTQKQAAQNLLEEHGLEGIKKALNFAAKFKEDPYCPSITSPYDLDSKWGNLLAYKQKHT